MNGDVEHLVRPPYRAALWALVLVLLLSPLASVTRAATPATTTYTLTGYVDQPGGVTAPPVPSGVQVDLQSAATGTVYTAVTTAGGQFAFSSASGASALAPGYWKLWVPVETNVTLSGCSGVPCAVLPVHQNPTYQYFNASVLTNRNSSTTIANVQVLPYNATLNGTVLQNGTYVPGATLRLLDPLFNGIALTNSTSNATGNFSIAVPFGKWVLQTTHVSGPDTFSNSSRLTITARHPPIVKPVLTTYGLSGWINSTVTNQRVPVAGNVTLYDPTNGYIYSAATPPGGFYSIPTYAAGFTTGANTFDVILGANGYATTSFSKTVPNANPITQNVLLSPLTASEMGYFNTTLNYSGIKVLTTGNGTLNVSTTVTLGNNSVLPGLPNASVGQLWAQLGLDYDGSLTFNNATSGAAVRTYINDSGPFFQAASGTVFNGTSFILPKVPSSLSGYTYGCSATCGLASNGAIGYSWKQNYQLNGTVGLNSSSYTVGFTFLHPAASSMTYNYTVIAPAGYVLSADTSAPAHTNLTAQGPSGTWGKFTLVSHAWSTASASASFTFVKTANLTPVVNVTGSSFAFSSAAVLNSSVNNYTVVLGVNENATFSAANSIYPTGVNGTSYVWNFGNGYTAPSTSNKTLNYSYPVASPVGHNFTGTLTVTDSGGAVNSSTFYVYVLASTNKPTAVISANVTANNTTTTPHGNLYFTVQNGTTVGFNATAPNVTLPFPNKLSIASYTLVAKGVKKIANFTTSSGGNASANWSVEFSPTVTLGAGPYLTQATINGTVVHFYGWQYNLTMTVWSVTGTSATTNASILVVDKMKPTVAFTLLNLAGKVISATGITENLPNGTGAFRVNAANSTGPSNSSIVKFSLEVNYTNNTSVPAKYWNATKATPYPTFWLAPLPNPYTLNLTVTDLAGNTANLTRQFSIAPNTTTRPIMQATNFTGPTSLTQGDSYTFSFNVTNTGGAKSFAKTVTVAWYLLSPSGTGSRKYISVTTSFYNVSKGVINTTTPYVGSIPSLAANKTVLARMTWSPGFSGNYVIYGNVTATNEYIANYNGAPNVVSMSIGIKVSTLTELIEYGGIAAAVILVLVAIIWWYRRPSRKGGSGKPLKPAPASKSGLERGGKKPDTDDDDEP